MNPMGFVAINPTATGQNTTHLRWIKMLILDTT
jgi:hypothetical protein